MNGYGVDPSKKAIQYGKKRIDDLNYPIELFQGTSDELPFPDNMFQIVVLGFCLFWVDRKYLFRTVAEVDRVLQTGGILLINDFDTIVPYKRMNCHNKDAFTYKMDYSRLWLSNPQYYLIGKMNYSHESETMFHADIQERVSATILYKEEIDNAYIHA